MFRKLGQKQILLSWISMVLHHKHYLMILVSSVIHYWYWFPIQGWFWANFSVFENSIFSSGPEQWHQLLWEMKPEGWRQLPCFALSKENFKSKYSLQMYPILKHWFSIYPKCHNVSLHNLFLSQMQKISACRNNLVLVQFTECISCE